MANIMELEDIYKDLDPQMEHILRNYTVENIQLGIKHLAYVIAAMVKVAAKWHNIGVFLGVDSDKLDGFRTQYKRDSDCCLIATIDAWLRGGSAKCTWLHVVIAVGSETAGANPAEAERLASEKFGSMLGGVPQSAGVDTKSLGEADLTQVRAALNPVADRWMAIGVFLGLKHSRLKLAAEDEDDMMRYIAQKYVKKDFMFQEFGEPTWKRVVEAIGSRAGGDNPRHAEEIAKKHLATRIVEDTDSSVESESRACKPGGISACIDRNPGARGLAVVVTNDYMKTTDALPGTREDAKSLLETFLFARFIVCCQHCATGDEILQLIEEVKDLKAEQVKDYQCILFAFSGHGDEDDWICMEDSEKIHVKDHVLFPLLPESAPQLEDIPKVIFSDACRGEYETQTTQIKKKSNPTDIGERKPHHVASEGNYLIASATLPKHCAYMSPDNLGSAWTQILAAELQISKKELQSVLTSVNDKLEKRAQKDKIEFQQPITSSTLKREVYIHPDCSTEQKEP